MLDFSKNIKLPQEKLDKIGLQVCEDFKRDKHSRIQWEEQNTCAMKLALQVMEKKTYPWENASNIKFPLLTIASIQFSARAYPALVSPTEVVKCRVNGPDPEGAKTERAKRVSRHMTYQILEEDEDWEEEHDKLLMALPIVGTMFKKSYYDPLEKHNESILVSPVDLVVGYFTKSLESARRITHVIPLYENEYIERVNKGLFNKIDLGEPSKETTISQDAQNEVHGLYDNDSDPPHIFLEQHGYLDLDGDGYKEPYIITVHKDTQKVVRIVNRFGNIEKDGDKIICIEPRQYFTKYGFIPSPDGGFYDLGFGNLLGPLNESVNSVINQLVDAGTMSNLQGGFLGRGIRIKGGKNRFRPGEWKNVDNYGDDLRKGVFPMPVREPSNVLFSLLGMLVQYGERLSSSTDMMVGVNPGQNQAASTTMAVVEQGMKVFNGIFKRIYRSMGMEFRKLYLLNRENLNPYDYFEYLDEKNPVYLTDYHGPVNDITPASDPNIVSEAQRLAKAEALRNAAAGYYGYDRYEIEKRYLQALEVEGIEQVLPDPEGDKAIPPPSDPKIELDKAKLELQKQKADMDNQFNQMKLKISEMQAMISHQKQQTSSELDIAKTDLTKVEAVKTVVETEKLNEGTGVRRVETQS